MWRNARGKNGVRGCACACELVCCTDLHVLKTADPITDSRRK